MESLSLFNYDPFEYDVWDDGDRAYDKWNEDWPSLWDERDIPEDGDFEWGEVDANPCPDFDVVTDSEGLNGDLAAF